MSKPTATDECHPGAYRFDARLDAGETVAFGDEIPIREEWLDTTTGEKTELVKRTGHVIGAWKNFDGIVTARICVPGWEGPR